MDPSKPDPVPPKSAALLWVAQGFGLGRIPWAPGTFGTVGGLVWLAVLLAVGGLWPAGSFWLYVLGMLASFALSVWLCGAAERMLGQPDPGSVVLDEIVAVPLCFLVWVASEWFSLHHWPAPAELWHSPGAGLAVAGFVLFRIFDIAKPWPVKQSQALPGGWGITVDDLLAALYVNLVLVFFVR